MEAVSGIPLNEYIEEKILKALEIRNSGTHTTIKPALIMHLRGADGSPIAAPAITAVDNLEVYGGGDFLVSTLDGYSRFLLAVLNGGRDTKTGTQLLKRETVREFWFEDHIHRSVLTGASG